MSGLSSYFGEAMTPLSNVRITSPPAWLFKFPPSPIPLTLPPPPSHPSIEHPFHIPADVYNAALSVNVPVTIALVYATIVSYLNTVNAKRKFRPWGISKSPLFKLFAIVHNLFLALYSAWTFVGMFNALKNSVEPWTGEHGLAGTVDSLCKLHGPRGLGSAATYNHATSSWGLTDLKYRLASDGLLPDSTDVGRIWNEGLAFYGWIFYLSKFYEVVDTFIILAKGKKSSLLQTYHHTGAMLCMWAGIRYMSPPIWMFCLVNSFIHTIMYTFYLTSVLGIRVPKWFKQTLTTMQITQIVFGGLYAFAHLFISYQIPISVPYLYQLGNIASKVASSLPSDASSVSSDALATATANLSSWLKKAALRAAGHEGLAQNVLNEKGQTFGVDAAHAMKDYMGRQETRYREELSWVHCLDTDGEAFAILLNCLYFAPLTFLFVQFFTKAYMKRSEQKRRRSSASIAGKSGRDAVKGIARQLSEAMEEMSNTAEEIGEDGVVIDGEALKREMRDGADAAKKAGSQAVNKVKKGASKIDSKIDSGAIKQEVKQDLEKVRKGIKDAADKSRERLSEYDTKEATEKVKKVASEASNYASEKVTETVEKVEETYASVAHKATEETSTSTSTNTKSESTSKHESSSGTDDDKTATQQQSPNGNGTGAGEASEHQSSTTSGQIKTEDSEQAEKEKKIEDKIIDESQLVRDKDVDKVTEPKSPKADDEGWQTTPSKKGNKRRG